MAVQRNRITKVPQCRHKDIYVSYQTVAGGYTATCSNCTQVSATKTTREEARNDLMRLIGDPAVTEIET
jgi:hypothetical protein